jgi:hypothetical protein
MNSSLAVGAAETARPRDGVVRAHHFCGANGYGALFEIDDATTLTLLALRHQREEDFH